VLRPPAGTFTEMEIQFIMSESIETRRDFLQKLAMATSAVVLMPIVSACSGPDVKPDEQPTTIPAGGMTREPMAEAAKPTDVPMTAPEAGTRSPTTASAATPASSPSPTCRTSTGRTAS